MKKFFIFLLCFTLVSCGIKQIVIPVEVEHKQEICILEDPAVRTDFLKAYIRALEEKGFHTKTVPQDSNTKDCDLVTTYYARWSWDITIYMSYTQIKVYQKGDLVGEALYDSRFGGGRHDKFINAGEKIRELVNELF